ncbi:hypothetical protein [Streptomyces sp. NPDC101234]|uniref:hypothetical protein n=1 Tax=Streptomyces sp. NPDC101234 TaxID=3366138 RepID=UPI00382FE3C3
MLVGQFPRGRAQFGDQQVFVGRASCVRVLLYGAGEGAQRVGELGGQSRVLVEEGLDEGEDLCGVGVLAQVFGQVRERFGQGADRVRGECGHRAP